MTTAISSKPRRLVLACSIFRPASCAFFFIAIWVVGGILLAPELKTRWTTIGAIQLGIAGGMLSRRTMPFSAPGIVILYAIAIRKYGPFYLADYPVFLGVAAYLALLGIQSTFFRVRPIDVLRWTTSVTVMWASIENGPIQSGHIHFYTCTQN